MWQCYRCKQRKIAGNATVHDNARIDWYAKIYDDAVIGRNARVTDHARVYGYAQLIGYAEVGGSARVCEEAHIGGFVEIHGSAHVGGKTEIFSNAVISDYARIYDSNDCIVINGIGYKNETITFYPDKRGYIRVKSDDFSGSLYNFWAKANAIYKDTRYGANYILISELVEKHFS